MSNPKYFVKQQGDLWCVLENPTSNIVTYEPTIVATYDTEVKAKRKTRNLNRQFNKNQFSVKHIAILKFLYQRVILSHCDISNQTLFQNKRKGTCGADFFIKDLLRMGYITTDHKRMFGTSCYWITAEKLELVEQIIKPRSIDLKMRTDEIKMIEAYREAKCTVREYEERRFWTAKYVFKVIPLK